MTTPSNRSFTQLTNLFPSASYRLAYTLPLFALSVLLAFAGAFLTLDRTRSFRPRSDPLHVPGSFNLTKRPKRVSLYLQGGLGGVAIGYSFGRTYIYILHRKVVVENRISQYIWRHLSHWSSRMKRLLRH